MGFFSSIFTWWNGATIGTSLFTRANGRKVGTDELGNVYFESRKEENGLRRRWVIYQGANDASRIPPDWYGWLCHQHDTLPDDMPAPRTWQQPAKPNMTGTVEAYRPAGALEAGGRRAAATGDYQAWSPDAS